MSVSRSKEHYTPSIDPYLRSRCIIAVDFALVPPVERFTYFPTVFSTQRQFLSGIPISAGMFAISTKIHMLLVYFYFYYVYSSRPQVFVAAAQPGDMRLLAYLKSSFAAGAILIAPLVVTVYVLRLLVNWSLQFVDPVVASVGLAQYTGNVEVAAQVLAVVLILSVVTVLGVLAQWSIGQHLFDNVGRAIYIVPMVSTIYSGIRQVATALVDRESRFERTVLVEYPRESVYSIGFVTSEGEAAIDEVAGEQAKAVFLPNSPNPTAGRLVMVPSGQIHDTDMSVRQGMRLIVTTGITSTEEEIDALPTEESPGESTA